MKYVGEIIYTFQFHDVEKREDLRRLHVYCKPAFYHPVMEIKLFVKAWSMTCSLLSYEIVWGSAWLQVPFHRAIFTDNAPARMEKLIAGTRILFGISCCICIMSSDHTNTKTPCELNQFWTPLQMSGTITNNTKQFVDKKIHLAIMILNAYDLSTAPSTIFHPDLENDISYLVV